MAELKDETQSDLQQIRSKFDASKEDVIDLLINCVTDIKVSAKRRNDM